MKSIVEPLEALWRLNNSNRDTYSTGLESVLSGLLLALHNGIKRARAKLREAETKRKPIGRGVDPRGILDDKRVTVLKAAISAYLEIFNTYDDLYFCLFNVRWDPPDYEPILENHLLNASKRKKGKTRNGNANLIKPW